VFTLTLWRKEEKLVDPGAQLDWFVPSFSAVLKPNHRDHFSFSVTGFLPH